MFLKRKRSEDELSSFSSSAIGCSSPALSENGNVVMMDVDHSVSPRSSVFMTSLPNRSRSCTPSHLHSRTFKRLRNGRPSDQEVHQNTLKLLYQAQQPSPHQDSIASPPVSSTPVSPMPFSQAPSAQKQSSLHSFWRIPTTQSTPAASLSTDVSAAGPSLADTVDRPTICEDCGVGLNEEDCTMDDGYGFETYINACSACAKAVCFSCSVSNLGEQRRCLACAGKQIAPTDESKNWAGTMRWPSHPSNGVFVC
ncbi:hypothetical protein BD289DRAFT_481938 [Coniella lustricola]|uniref:Uncharacterized protein n=1 Tax=Coniella lustricola TaxID=2025994 RepID=A0A2T3AAP5_9PEZI|nr:hypothetical protein BD289DRAFT_481938 [Coniella lustricola]